MNFALRRVLSQTSVWLTLSPSREIWQEVAAHAVPRRQQDPIVGYDERHGDGRRRARPGMIPEHAARRGIVARHARLIERDDLVYAGERREHRRAVAGKIVAGPPDGLSRIAMVGNQRAAGRPSDADDDQIVDGEW